MSRDIFARQLTIKLHKTEKAIDLALAETSEQIAMMLRGRLDHSFAAQFGHDALCSMAQTQAGLFSSRQAVVAAHTQLKAAADDLGVSYIVAAGPQTKPSEDGPRIRPTGDIRRVA